MSDKIISSVLDFIYNGNVVEITPTFLESKQQSEILAW